MSSQENNINFLKKCKTCRDVNQSLYRVNITTYAIMSLGEWKKSLRYY